MMTTDLRVGLVGAGYIADWHANCLRNIPGVTLVGVCDPVLSAAEGLAIAHDARGFASLSSMMSELACDAVHILTPPHLHAPLAIEALEAGAHVLVEKPFATALKDAEAMCAAAASAGRQIGVNHNFLGLPAYQRLRKTMQAGLIGRVDQASVHWHYPLQPLRTGPFGIWMLQRPENLMLELGPHLHAFVQDLFGPMEEMDLRLMRPVTLPTGRVLPQGWRVQGRAGVTEVTLSVSLTEGTDDRALRLRGVVGSAEMDFGKDRLVLTRDNPSDIIVNSLRTELSQARAHLREGLRNAWVQTRSLNRRQPYALGFEGLFAGFYDALRKGSPLPSFCSGAAACEVIGQIEALQPRIPERYSAKPAAPALASGAPDCLVIGGTGFLGRELVRQLVAEGQIVGVLSRTRSNPFAGIEDRVQLVTAALHDDAALRDAMTGIGCVYHLAKAEESTWEGYLKNDVGVTERLARAAIDARVARFLYSGTIASYDASNPTDTITEDTAFGDMSARNLYARSKALCEERLMALHHSEGLPVIIARPGIVVGPGGPLQHWGIGRWHGAGAVRVWGDGHNKLPFVLNEDVARGMVLMANADGLEGRSFNLVGPPLLSARGWFDAIAAQTGTRIEVASGNLLLFWAGDQVKYALKRHVLGRKSAASGSWRDWHARAHLARFSNRAACETLNWTPVSNRAEFIARAIVPAQMFGF
ncbi:MAG: NAD-dependent epimerase/dehydratase family protein [Roseinatronobacter sp.]